MGQIAQGLVGPIEKGFWHQHRIDPVAEGNDLSYKDLISLLTKTGDGNGNGHGRTGRDLRKTLSWCKYIIHFKKISTNNNGKGGLAGLPGKVRRYRIYEFVFDGFNKK